MPQPQLRRAPHLPEPSAVPIVAGGTCAWAVALVVLVAARHSAWMAGHHRWIAVCAAGVSLGIAGVIYCVWRERRLASADSTASPSTG